MNKKPSKVPVEKLIGQWLPRPILERLEQIAKSRRSSVGAVMEKIAEEYLPELEALYGITPDAPTKAKPSSRAKPRVKSPKRRMTIALPDEARP